jgi:hypothetical protein
MAEATTQDDVQTQVEGQEPMTDVMGDDGSKGGTPDLPNGTAQCVRCIWYPWTPGADTDALPVERCHPAIPPRRWSDGGDVAIHNCPYFEERPDMHKLYLTPVTEKPTLEGKPIPFHNGSGSMLELAANEVVIGGVVPDVQREEVIVHSPIPGHTFAAANANAESLDEARDAHKERFGGTWGEKLEVRQAMRPTAGQSAAVSTNLGVSRATQELLDTGMDEKDPAKREQARVEAAQARADEGVHPGLNQGGSPPEGAAASASAGQHSPQNQPPSPGASQGAVAATGGAAPAGAPAPASSTQQSGTHPPQQPQQGQGAQGSQQGQGNKS